jgi:hypothetical protein
VFCEHVPTPGASLEFRSERAIPRMRERRANATDDERAARTSAAIHPRPATLGGVLRSGCRHVG